MFKINDEIILILWKTSFLLVILALSLLIILILLRGLRDEIARKSDIRKKYFEKIIITYLGGSFKIPDVKIIKNNQDIKIISEIVDELFHDIKGDLKDNLLKFLKDNNIYDILIKTIKSGKNKDKIIAIRLLSNWKNTEVCSFILQLIKDKNKKIQMDAIYALANIGYEFTFDEVLMYIKDNIKSFSTPTIFNIFIKFGLSISDKLENIIKWDYLNNEIIVAALKYFSFFQNIKSVESIIDIYDKNRNPLVEESIYQLLSRVQLKVPEYIIVNGLNNENLNIRIYSLKIAANYWDKFIENIIGALKDSNFMIARTAGEIIFGINEQLLVSISRNENSTSGIRAKLILKEKRMIA